MDEINENKNDKIRGCLIGGAIGDALGYPIEFKRNIRDREKTRFNGEGIISDDTQMTLFTANGLLWRETRLALRGIAMEPPFAVYLAYKDWYDTQTGKYINDSISWIKDIEELNVQRFPGSTCLSAIASGKMGTISNPLNNSKGCGGLMRVAPIGLYGRDIKSVGKYAADISAITHGHPLGIIPSYVFCVLINLLLNTDMKIDEALEKALEYYYKNFDIYPDTYRNAFIEKINLAKELSKKSMSDTDAIKLIGEGWVAEEALAIALYACLKYSYDFESAIVCAVNHDGDSDSTGAIAGNIMGVYVGYSNIPDYYLENLELKNVILEIADDLSVNVPVSEYNMSDEYWISKYLYIKKDRKD